MTANPAQLRRQAADDEFAREHADRSAARRRSLDAQQHAAAEQAERDTATARAQLDAIPVDDTANDDEVRALEERIAAGDDTVTAEQLTEARTAAAGRSRFARLRSVFADRQARRNAEQTERDQAAAADQAARDALSGFLPADLVPLYDQAAAALTALVRANEARNTAIRALTTLPAAHRPRGAVVDVGAPFRNVLTLDEVEQQQTPTALLIERALGRARLSGKVRGVVDPRHTVVDADPSLIARGRQASPGGEAA